MEEEGYRTRWFTDRTVLVIEDEARLSAWMQENLQLGWAEDPEPWTVEDELIGLLEPSLNQAGNRQHPMYRHVRDARARWRTSAQR